MRTNRTIVYGFLAVMLALALTGCPEDIVISDTDGDFEYEYRAEKNPITGEYTNESVTITGYTGDGGDLTIPAEIDKKAVTEIGPLVFQYKGLTNVTIPNSINSIGQEAFFGNQLTDITIPNSVKSIRTDAFCVNPLISITIGKNVMLESIYRTCFPGNFDEVYNNAGKAAGTYTSTNNGATWKR